MFRDIGAAARRASYHGTAAKERAWLTDWEDCASYHGVEAEEMKPQ